MKGEEKILLSWEVIKGQRDSNTILLISAVFVATVAAAIYFFYTKEYLNGLVFVVLFLVLIWYFFASPKSASMSILENGFKINNQLYKFDNFKSYWISGKTGVFYFEPNKRIGSIISMPSGTKNVEEIKSYLPEDIIEGEDRGDDFTNRMSAIFKI